MSNLLIGYELLDYDIGLRWKIEWLFWRLVSQGKDWANNGEGLNERLELLHKRVQRGSYRAQPARRVYIPKADGSQRPLSILCSSRRALAGTPLLSTSIYVPVITEATGFTYRGLAPHKITPMPGVPQGIKYCGQNLRVE